MKENKHALRIPIGFKLVTVIASLLASSTLVLVFMAVQLFTRDKTSFIDQTNHDVAAQFAEQTHDYLNLLVGVMTTMTEIQTEKLDVARKNFDLAQQFARNEEIQAIATWTLDGKAPTHTSYKNTKSDFTDFMLTQRPSAVTWAGELDIRRVTVNGRGFVALSFPLVVDAGKKVITATVGLIDQSRFIKIYGKGGAFTSYLVDRQGNVLAHPHEEYVNAGANFKDVPIVREMLESPVNNKKLEFVDKDGRSFLGNFRLVGVAGIGVVSQIEKSVALEAVKRVRRDSFYTAGMILFLSFGVAYFFSNTLTKPIKALVALTREIAAGNFKVKVEAKGRDEITELTQSFGKMTEGLVERDKLKDTFNKFHSKEIAEAILKGEIKLGGNRQDATVFFSDIRSFTSISEQLNAEEVVEMLNEYMTAMVSEITAHHGVVDKYVGDAIMAVWGVPLSHGNDAWNAVRASIAMRRRLAVFNEGRIARGQKPINIGMGLHTGPLIAGNIGSIEKMEYTVIGDTVNTASRIESLTKEFGTDLLISEEVYLKIKDKVIVEAVQASVKGKSKALTAYKVRGYVDEAGKEILVETPYSSYEASHSDKVIDNKSA